MSFPRYPAYKAAGVQWLVEVPSHWIGPKKIGDVSSLKGRLGWQGLKADEYREEGPLVVSSAHFSNFKIRWEECPHVSWERYELDANIQLSVEDILLMKDGAALGKLAYVDELPDAACLNSHLLLFRPLQDGHSQAFIPKFAFYYMQSSLFQEFMQTRGTGATFMGVSQETIARHLIHWPLLEEQRTIVGFLDRETAKIDALVAEQEQLISLLKEKRQAVISHAVTKGLDPSVPMKDSGVEWLGQVPGHWVVKQIRQITQILRGKFTHRPRNDPAFYDGDYPFIQTGDVTGARRFITEFKQTLNDQGAAVSKEFPRGTLVMTIAANIGDVAVLDFPAYFPDSMVGLVPGSDVDLMFLFYLMRSMKQPLEMNATVSTQMNLNVEQIGSLSACCPPIAEQRDIVQWLDAETHKLDCLIEEARAASMLLQERRSALISAAVTGQIDVRSL